MRKQKSARECALTMLERCDRTEQEMRQKLKEKQYQPEEIDPVIDFLKEYRYIDDRAYTERYICANASRKSRRRLRYDLERKGICPELIESGLEETPVEEEEQIRRFLTKKGWQPGVRMEMDQYRKVTAALNRKGFSYETILRVVHAPAEEERW